MTPSEPPGGTDREHVKVRVRLESVIIGIDVELFVLGPDVKLLQKVEPKPDAPGAVEAPVARRGDSRETGVAVGVGEADLDVGLEDDERNPGDGKGIESLRARAD